MAKCEGNSDAAAVMASEPVIIQRCEQPIESVDEFYDPTDCQLTFVQDSEPRVSIIFRPDAMCEVVATGRVEMSVHQLRDFLTRALAALPHSSMVRGLADVDRLARALCIACGGDPDEPQCPEPELDDVAVLTIAIPAWRNYRGMALRVLAALPPETE